MISFVWGGGKGGCELRELADERSREEYEFSSVQLFQRYKS
jgi:hypothetical protein